jgi:6-phosphogluconolactonase
MNVTVLPSLAALSGAAAEIVADVALASVAARGSFAIALAGGGTPRGTYERLATGFTARIPWDRTEVYFGDERCVEPTHPESNFRMVSESLLSRVAIPTANIHPVRASGEAPALVAEEYEGLLRRRFDDGPAEVSSIVERDGTALREIADAVDGNVRPTFDLTILGMGEDGHTASLFPGAAALEARLRWVAATTAPPDAAVRDRITLTLPMLNRSRSVLFLCAGRRKREVLRQVLAGGSSAARYPAARVRGIEETRWLVDEEAGG